MESAPLAMPEAGVPIVDIEVVGGATRRQHGAALSRRAGRGVWQSAWTRLHCCRTPGATVGMYHITYGEPLAGRIAYGGELE